MKLIVGLGNPGIRYQLTRHNVGFLALDAFVDKNIGLEVNWKKKYSSRFVEHHFKGQKILLAKPQTYMNLSGKAVEEICNYYNIANHQLLVVYDDINLPLGRIRVRRKGSAGGHRGIESIIQCLGTDNFPRLRIGIRNDGLLRHMDYSSFVLANFLQEEEQMLEGMIKLSVKVVEDILEYGYEHTMRQYNQLDQNTSSFE